jgi:hypothetical protein
MEFFIDRLSPHAPTLEGDEFLQPDRPAEQQVSRMQAAAIRFFMALAFMRSTFAFFSGEWIQ